MVPRAIDLRMSVVRIANGGTLLLFMAFYDLSLYIADYDKYFCDYHGTQLPLCLYIVLKCYYHLKIK